MREITTIEELMKVLEGNGCFGLRGASDHDLEVADRGYLDCSLDLWDSRECDFEDGVETLNGTSALGVNEYMSADEVLERYKGALGYATIHHTTKTVYLLNDTHQEYGVDENEVVLGHDGYGADIVAIVKL